jgi:UDP-hydrolysing UDP-N-acetyl-D-glucosamine 2-epimerase
VRRIGVVTTARSDFSIWLPVLRAIDAHEGLALELCATGSHLDPEFGRTADEIASQGFALRAQVQSLDAGDDAPAAARTLARGVAGFGELFADWRPDLLLVLGDRLDMVPAPLAALPHRIPVGHVHGGEVTEGAIDESLRHCVTKLSHLHFASTEAHARRIVQLGEEPWRVHVTGAPGIDALAAREPCGRAELERRFGIPSGERFVLVTVHPETLSPAAPEAQLAAVLAALDKLEPLAVFTAPNADPAGRALLARLREHCAGSARARLIENAGPSGYTDLLAHAEAMLGNSSSGLIEAPVFALPVVNVGERQRGRLCGANVIHVPLDERAIRAGLLRALAPSFRRRLSRGESPYGDGHAAQRIVRVLDQVELSSLLPKRFHDVPREAGT